jgi:cob(I)alamin adenosyltransferase
MTRFYTKKGDDGYTGLLGEGRAAKYDLRIETIGAIDEANAAIALARSLSKAPETEPTLLAVQKDLYHLMAEISATPENSMKFRQITASRVQWLETQIDEISSKVHIPDEFILPGDSTSGAAIDLARTVVRRAERHLAQLLHTGAIENSELLHYMNRLSSLCFVLEILEYRASGNSYLTLVKQ